MPNPILMSGLNEILKKDILPVIADQLNQQTYFLNKISKDRRDGFANNTIYKTLRTGRNESIRAVGAASTDLPGGGTQKRAQAKVDQKSIFGVFELDIRTIKNAQGKERDTIVNILVDESEGMKTDLSKDLNRQLLGYGDGRLTTVSALGETTSLITVRNTKYIEKGQLITIGAAATKVANVLSDTTFTVTGSINTATNAVIVKTGGEEEMAGLFMAADNGTFTETFENISAASNHFWKSFIENTTETYTDHIGMEADMRAGRTAVQKYGKCDLILTTFELLDKYKTVYGASQRFMNTVKLEGGFGDAVTFDGTPVVADFDCPDGVMYFIDWDALSLEYTTPMEWMEGTEGILMRVPTKTYYEASLYVFGNLLVENRRKLAKLYNKS